MTQRLEMVSLLAAMACCVAMGCAAPYTYYGDEQCGGTTPATAYAELSGRYSDVAPGSCDACVECGETACLGHHTLTDLLLRSQTCNAGCSGMYWGEWTYDPPDECDPCNNHGQWVGQRCCAPRGWARVLDGIIGRRGGLCDQATPCADCLSGGSTYDGFDSTFESDLDGLDSTGVEILDRSSAESPDVPYYGRDPNSRLIHTRQR